MFGTGTCHPVHHPLPSLLLKTECLAGIALPTLDGAKLSLVDQVKSVGMRQDLALLMDKQVSAVVRNALFQLLLVYKLAPYLYNPVSLALSWRRG